MRRAEARLRGAQFDPRLHRLPGNVAGRFLESLAVSISEVFGGRSCSPCWCPLAAFIKDPAARRAPGTPPSRGAAGPALD
ncbi:hypothetical protein GCM10017559_77440 [Streptosporangium longisporum]|uniref:Uncharacterized protein n=1 Tax=Streptosporangium longisporum TaxID=46187 RepID=A0ABP6LBY6_9ACTN